MTRGPATPAPDALMVQIDEIIMAAILNRQSLEAIATYLNTDIGLVRERAAAVRADGRLYRFRLPRRNRSKPESLP